MTKHNSVHVSYGNTDFWKVAQLHYRQLVVMGIWQKIPSGVDVAMLRK